MAVPQVETGNETYEDCEFCRHENVTIVMKNEERVPLSKVFTHLFEHEPKLEVHPRQQVELRTMIMVYHTVAMQTGLPLFAHHIRALTRRVCHTPLPADGAHMFRLDKAKLRMDGSVEEVPIMDLIAQIRGIDEAALGDVLEEHKGTQPAPPDSIHAMPKDASVTDDLSDVDSETDAFGITPHPLAMQMWKDRLQELAKEGRTYTTEDRFDHIMKWRSKNWPKYMKEKGEKDDKDLKEMEKNLLDEKEDGSRRKAPKRGLQDWDEIDKMEAADSSSSSSSSVLPSASSSDKPK